MVFVLSPDMTGNELRSLRESQHIGLRQMSALTEISFGYLSLIEKGLRPVPHDLRLKYEKVLLERLTEQSASLGLKVVRNTKESKCPATPDMNCGTGTVK